VKIVGFHKGGEMVVATQLIFSLIVALIISALLQKTCHKNKKSGEYFKIRILKAPPRHLYPLVGC